MLPTGWEPEPPGSAYHVYLSVQLQYLVTLFSERSDTFLQWWLYLQLRKIVFCMLIYSVMRFFYSSDMQKLTHNGVFAFKRSRAIFLAGKPWAQPYWLPTSSSLAYYWPIASECTRYWIKTVSKTFFWYDRLNTECRSSTSASDMSKVCSASALPQDLHPRHKYILLEDSRTLINGRSTAFMFPCFPGDGDSSLSWASLIHGCPHEAQDWRTTAEATKGLVLSLTASYANLVRGRASICRDVVECLDFESSFLGGPNSNFVFVVRNFLLC